MSSTEPSAIAHRHSIISVRTILVASINEEADNPPESNADSTSVQEKQEIDRSIDQGKVETTVKPTQETQIENAPKKLTPRDLLERIPIAGLYNLLHANGKKEKLAWIGLLLL